MVGGPDLAPPATSIQSMATVEATMRPIRFPWGRKALALRRAEAAHAWQEQERQDAFARIAGLADTVPEWDITDQPTGR